MNLTIDIGNTQTKIIVFNDTMPVFRKVTNSLSLLLVKKIVRNYSIENILLSSVVDRDKPLLNYLKTIKGFEVLSTKTKLPIKNKYKTPATLGNDRLANAVAGAFLFPGKNVLIVDIGTCIKFDIVNARKEYLGGSISPGMELRFKSLHHFTGKLPLIHESSKVFLVGKTTQEAIQSGVINGMTEEIAGIVQRYKKIYKTLTVIVTGGHTHRFAGELKFSIFAAADMVNIGLNEIIRFNRSV
jgi:type III pantothenate kinase